MDRRQRSFEEVARSPHLKLTLAGDPSKVNREARTVQCTITTQEVDHDLEVVLTKGLDLRQWMKNPIVLFMHDHYAPVGRAVDVDRRDDRILSTVKFSTTELANDVLTWYADGTARGWSIGMNPMTIKRRRITEADVRKNTSWAGAELIVEKAQLMELSAVTIPCNDAALTKVFDSKTAGPIIRRWFEARGGVVEVVRDAAGEKVIPIPIQTGPIVLPRTG